ncbi:MAG: hypothetical protein ACXAEN_27205 [Candidatus Thorarchaeota archaeon]|jgi:hypothetical protein
MRTNHSRDVSQQKSYDQQIETAESMVAFLESAPQSRRTSWMLTTYRVNLRKLREKKAQNFPEKKEAEE